MRYAEAPEDESLRELFRFSRAAGDTDCHSALRLAIFTGKPTTINEKYAIL